MIDKPETKKSKNLEMVEKMEVCELPEKCDTVEMTENFEYVRKNEKRHPL